MSGPWIVIAFAAVAAIVAAAADGALLALDPTVVPAQPALARLVTRRESSHRALAFVRLLAYLSAGAGAGELLGMQRESAMSWREQLLLAAVVLLAAACEGTARSAGDALAERAAEPMSRFVRLAELVATPVVALSAAIDAALSRALPPPAPDEESREATAEQFREVVAAEADVSRDDAALLHRAFSLGETEVREVMIPRVDIVGIDRDSPWSEVLDRVRSSEHARLPVYEHTVDQIEGILYAKDLLAAVVTDVQPADWRTLIRPANFIPPSKRVDDQLREFRATGSHIAIVADEYGGTEGLVTIEDVLEELVGEIHDEYDTEEIPSVHQEDGSKYWVAGGLTLEELSELLDHDLRRDDVTTVAGLIYTLLGRVPRSGEEVGIDGFRVVVERVVKRRIERVYFERPEPRRIDDMAEDGE